MKLDIFKILIFKIKNLLLIALTFNTLGCELGVEVQNQFQFEGINSVRYQGNKIYQFQWDRVKDYPKTLEIKYKLLNLGVISNDAYIEAGMEPDNGIVEKKQVLSSDGFKARKNPEISIIVNEEKALVPLDLESGFYYMFQVVPQDEAIKFDENKVFAIAVAEANAQRNWNFAGIERAILTQDGVELSWNTPSGDGAVDQDFLYEIYQGTTFSNVVETTYNTNIVMSYDSVSFENGSTSFGIRAIRVIDQVKESNNKLLLVKEPIPLVFEGILESDVETFENQTVKIKWNEALNNIGDVTYSIYVDKLRNELVEKTTETELTLRGLEIEKEYWFSVQAEDARGKVFNEQKVRVFFERVIDTTAPEFVGLKNAQALDKNSIKLSWDLSTSTDTEFYFIYLAEDLTNPIQKVGNKISQFDIIELEPDTKYQFIVRAIDFNKNLDGNQVIKSAKTLSSSSPSFSGITSAYPSNGSKGATEINLNFQDAIWGFPQPNAADESLFFDVYQWQLSDNSKTNTRNLGGNLSLSSAKKSSISRKNVLTNLKITIANLDSCHAEKTNCKRYCFLIRAVDKRNDKNFVDLNQNIHCLPTAQYTPPSFDGLSNIRTPSDLTGFNSLVVTFNPAKGFYDGYRTYWKTKTEQKFDFSRFIDSDTSVRSVTISNLEPLTEYDILTLAYENSSENSVTNLYGPREKILTGITKPENPVFSGVKTIENLEGEPGLSSLRVSFPNAYGAYNRYNFYIRKEDEAYKPHPDYVDLSTKTGTINFQITDLDFEQTYCVKVLASYSINPNSLTSENILVSANSDLSEKCLKVQIDMPEFESVNNIETSNISDSLSEKSLKVNFKNATGFFNRYIVFVGKSPDTMVEYGSLDQNLNIISGNLQICPSSANLSCLLIKKLDPDTTYYVTMKVVHSKYSQIQDVTSDNLMHPAVQKTLPVQNLLNLKEILDIDEKITAENVLSTLHNTDHLNYTTEIDSSNFDKRKALQVLTYSSPDEIGTIENLKNIQPFIHTIGSGFNPEFNDEGFGVKIDLINNSFFGKASHGSLEGSGDLNSLISSNGRTKLFASFRLDERTIPTGGTKTFKVDPGVASEFNDSEIQVGDEVLIYFAQDGIYNSKNVDDVGSYVITTITALNFPEITVEHEVFSPRNQTTLDAWTRLGFYMYKIPHFKDLTLTGDAWVSRFGDMGAYHDNSDHFNAGGIIAARVSGKTNLNGYSLNMSGKGYRGHTGPSAGNGQLSVVRYTNKEWGSGLAGNYGGDSPGGGGAGGGKGGDVPGSKRGGKSAGFMHLQNKIFFGGAGARGNSSFYNTSAPHSGGDGGGIVLLFSKYIENGSIKVNGQSQYGSNNYAGAGGGGSIWISSLLTKDLLVEAKGGSFSGAIKSSKAGGAGGGGRIRLDVYHSKNLTSDASAGNYYANLAEDYHPGDGTIFINPSPDSLSFIHNLGKIENGYIAQSFSTEEPITNDLESFFDSDLELTLLLTSLYSSSAEDSVDSVLRTNQAVFSYGLEE